MTQEERNRLATVFLGATKGLGIMSMILVFLGHQKVAGCLLFAAFAALTTCITLAMINFRIQAKEEWKP